MVGLHVALFRRSETQEKYIYETPDNGRTITRRVPMGSTTEVLVPTDDEPPITKEHGRWLSHDDLLNIGKQHFDEQRLRDKHPALQEAWEKYHLILALVKDENSYKTHKPSEK